MGKFLLIVFSITFVYFFFLWLEEKIYKSNFREDYYVIDLSRVSNIFRIIRIAFYIWLAFEFRDHHDAFWMIMTISILLLIAVLSAIISAKDKVIVMDDCLEIHSAFKKTLFMNILEIDEVTVTHRRSRKGGGITTTYVTAYSKGSALFVISEWYAGAGPFVKKLCDIGLLEPSKLEYRYLFSQGVSY